jgi:hypothetical protein
VLGSIIACSKLKVKPITKLYQVLINRYISVITKLYQVLINRLRSVIAKKIPLLLENI